MRKENHTLQAGSESCPSVNQGEKQQAMKRLGELYDVVQALRGENGCSWDRAQTHTSLKPFLIEEAYETVDAVTIQENGGGTAELQEELGDLLFQVMLHSEIGRQEGTFTLADVAGGISRKMVHRHPHVFPDDEGRKEKRDWDALKREEKPAETPQEEMDRIPHCFPALLRTQKVQKKLEEYDGTGGDREASCQRAQELLREVMEAADDREAAKSGGELLYEICNLLRLSGVNGEQALKDTLEARLDDRRKQSG